MIDFVRRVLFDWKYFPWLAAVLLLGEVVLSAVIVLKVPYTEIDWWAYMQEVQGFLGPGNDDGRPELDYLQLKGATGPLVYPAGFVYLYSVLSHVTLSGVNLRLGQWIFVGLYLVLQALTFGVLYKVQPKGAGPWVAILLCLSKRIHSIFMLRLFNDGIATILLMLAVLFFLNRRWSFGCFVYSAAVSIKMNVLLVAPALLFLMLRNQGPLRTLEHLAVCGFVQVFLGAPFLVSYPVSYLSKAFELSRVFTWEWTVNFRFLDEETFQSKSLALLLMAGHLLFLGLLVWRWGLVGTCGVRPAQQSAKEKAEGDPAPERNAGGGQVPARPGLRARNTERRHGDAPEKETTQSAPEAAAADTGCCGARASAAGWVGWLDRPWAAAGRDSDSPMFVAASLFAANFVGVCFARTLHYQFYSWYFHTLPVVAVAGGMPWFVWVPCMAVIEWAFNVFPSTSASSMALHTAHAVLLLALFTRGRRQVAAA